MPKTLFDLLSDPEAMAFAPPVAPDLRQKPSNMDVLNAGLAGVGDLAYSAAGFPVDLSSGLMRALGFNVGSTVGGSDWIKQKATQLGIRPPESADPTLRDVRLGAEIMSGGIDPFATAKGIGMAGSAIARESAPIIGRGLENYVNRAGLNANILPPEAAAKVMGQTRAVNEAGLPQVYYRGAKSEYAPLSSAGANEASKSGGIGLWMSKSPELASSYTGSQGLGHVSPTYVNLKNPLVIDAGESLWSQIPSKSVEDALGVKLSSPTVTTDQVSRIAKQRGFDGVQFKNVIDVKGGKMSSEAAMQPTDVVVAFDPKAARSALSDKAIAGAAGVSQKAKAPTQQSVQKQIAQAPVSGSGFYSAVEQAALNLEKKSGTGQGLLNELMKAPDVKKDEMAAIGLVDAFKDKPKATKQELIDYIGQNKVEMGQKVLSSKNQYPYQSADEWQNAIFAAERAEDWDEASNLETAWSQFEGQTRASGRTLPRYESYKLPGGTNYQETLLTLPNSTDPQKARLAFEQRMQQKYGSFNTMKFTDAEKVESESTMQAILDNDGAVSKGPVFKSTHWDEPNVLAHLRTQDFVDADGKNMRIIEEVQSDWHQAGREKGYKTGQEKSPAAIERELTVVTRKRSQLIQEAADIPDSEMARFKEMNAEIKRLGDEATKLNDEWINALNRPEGVPDAPMKETWYQTALRKAVKDAIDAGQDRVGITTGARQAERYDLSKQISEVNYSGTNFVAYDKNGDAVIQRTGVSEADLPDLIGKDAARKLLEQPKQGTLRSLSGVDLQVGGEGMKKYYDDVYPKYLEKFAKKYGATVKEGSVPTERSQDASGIPSMYPRQEPVRYIEITPEMRKAFGGKDKGVPLFQAAPLIPVGIGAGGLIDQLGERPQ